jgi:hypothetical protein
MWHLNLEKVRSALGPGATLGNVAIETGTLRGAGTLALARVFPRVITMELSEEIHRRAERRLRSNKAIRCLKGNSAALLPSILEELAGEPAVFFFLDAHWSGDASVNWENARWKGYGFDTAHLGANGAAPSGPEQCPLADELKAISAHCRGQAIILIDDAKNLPEIGPGRRGVEFPEEDWSHLSRASLRGLIGPRLKKEFTLKDPEQWLLCLSPL